MLKLLLYHYDRRKIAITLVLFADKRATVRVHNSVSVATFYRNNARKAAEAWHNGTDFAAVLAILMSLDWSYRWSRIAIEDHRIPEGKADDNEAA